MKRASIMVAALLLAGPAAAGTISITISQTARIADGDLVVEVTIGNSGDEAALSVVPVLRFGDESVRGKGTPSLAPNASLDETLTLPVGALGEGRWPYQIAVDYTDQNQYPFQALLAQALVVGNPPAAKVAVRAIAGTEVAGSGTLSVGVKNLTPDTRSARVRVLLPEGLEAKDPVRTVALEAWEEATLEVGVVNRTALVGSRYPVFVTAEYDDGGVHQAVVAQSVVAVTGADSFLDRNAGLLRNAAIALLAAWLLLSVVLVFRRRRGSGRGAGRQPPSAPGSAFICSSCSAAIFAQRCPGHVSITRWYSRAASVRRPSCRRLSPTW